MDDMDDDDDDEETPDLGDWRKFRASLIQQETAEEEDMMLDESVPSDTATPSSSSSSTTNNNNNPQQASSSSSTHKSSKTKPNNALNEALLAQQNQALADEYRQGVWAHVTTEPEVGGLLARLPLEAQLYYSATANDNQKTTSKTNTYWNKQLMQQLEKQQSSSSSNSSSSNSNTLSTSKGCKTFMKLFVHQKILPPCKTLSTNLAFKRFDTIIGSHKCKHMRADVHQILLFH